MILEGGNAGVPPTGTNPFSTRTATRGGAALVSVVFVVWGNPVRVGQRKTTHAIRSNQAVLVMP